MLKTAVCLNFLLFVIASATDCPDRWVSFNGSCYLFGHDMVHFTEAEEYCRQHSGYLVHVETEGENMFLRDFLRDFKMADYWIGMTDETVENVWKWYGTDYLVEYFDWGPSEPQNANNEDCAVFGDTIDYTWADVKCASNRKALCEMQAANTDIIGATVNPKQQTTQSNSVKGTDIPTKHFPGQQTVQSKGQACRHNLPFPVQQCYPATCSLPSV